MNSCSVLNVVLVVSIVTAGGVMCVESNSQQSSWGGQTNESHVLTESITSEWGIEYDLYFNTTNLSVVVESRNPNDDETYAGYKLEVDGMVQVNTDNDLRPSSEKVDHVNITESIDPTKDSHTVTIRVLGNEAEFEFDRKFDTTSPGRIPTPQITNVTIANGSIKGNASTVAHITISNPTNQLYPMKLMVHTVETGGRWYPASINTSESTTIKAMLFEDLGNETAGEARLYVDGPSNTSGALDQVEFVGQAGNGTEVYNRSYEPVTPPWEDDPYQYENESVRPDTDDDSPVSLDDAGDRPELTVIAGLVVFAGLALLYRRW